MKSSSQFSQPLIAIGLLSGAPAAATESPPLYSADELAANPPLTYADLEVVSF